jgi:hypothetical protein
MVVKGVGGVKDNPIRVYLLFRLQELHLIQKLTPLWASPMRKRVRA